MLPALVTLWRVRESPPAIKNQNVGGQETLLNLFAKQIRQSWNMTPLKKYQVLSIKYKDMNLVCFFSWYFVLST
jgi:hypothetical protein